MVAFTHPLAEGAHVKSQQSRFTMRPTPDIWFWRKNDKVLGHRSGANQEIGVTIWKSKIWSDEFGVWFLKGLKTIRKRHLWKRNKWHDLLNWFKQPGAVFLVQIWILRSILMEVWTCMEWNGAIGEEYVEDKRLAPFMIYVTLSIFHISSHWILSVCLLLAKHHCTFHTMCTSDARELILRHRKRWKPIRATRPTRLMMPAPQSLTVITVKIKGSDGNNHGDSEVCFFCPAFQYLDRFGGIQTPKGGAVLHPIQFTSWKLCEIRFAISEVQAADPTPNLEVQNCGVVLEVQDMFRQRKCLKLDAHFQGKTVQSFYSMRQKERQ